MPNKMNKAILIFILLFFLKFDKSYAQYTEIINSNRPGASSGAFSVGKDILQVENGLFIINEKHQLLNNKVNGYGFNFKIRYGLFTEKLEVVTEGIFQADNYKDLRFNPSNNFKRKNFKKFKIGLKYLIFDPNKGIQEKPNIYSYWDGKKFKLKNLIPAISTYVGLNIDSKNNPYILNGLSGINPSLTIITQSNLTYKTVLTTNFLLERIGSVQNDFEYIISLTHSFNQKFIGYFDKHGIKSDFYADNLTGFGIAYLYNNNLQFDLGTKFNFKETPSILFLNLGVSYRLDFNNNLND